LSIEKGSVMAQLVRVHSVKEDDVLTDGEVVSVSPAVGGMITLKLDTGMGYTYHMTRRSDAWVSRVSEAPVKVS